MADNKDLFNQRADNAALNLKEAMKLAPKSVEVGPDGRPPKPPPPEGSYLRMQMEAQRGQEALQQGGSDKVQDRAAEQQQLAPPQDGSIAGSDVRPDQSQPQDSQLQEQSQLSPGAQQRFSELTSQLRGKDQALQQATEESTRLKESNEETLRRLAALEQQHNEMLQANLENLDPETRLAVLQDARMREHMAGFEERILGRIAPQLETLQKNNRHQEMQALQGKYPAFDIQAHGPLIDHFQSRNQHCDVEMAFKAIAEPEELFTNAQAPAPAVPPTVKPGSGSLTPRYMPDPNEQSNPEQELIEESQRLKKLALSHDPEDKRMAARAWEAHLAKRYAHKLNPS